MPFELLDSGNRGQLGAVQRTARHDHEARIEDIAAIGFDRPAPLLVVPSCILNLSLKAGALVEIEVLADALSVREDLRREGILLLRYVSGLFEQRQIHIGFDVTLGARIAVPVPGSTKIASFFYDANVGDPDLLQPCRRQQSAEATADDHGVELFVQRGAGETRLDVGVRVVMLKRARDLLVLVVAVRTQASSTLRGVLLTQLGGVETQLARGWIALGFDSVTASLINLSAPFRLGCSGPEASQFFVLVSDGGPQPSSTISKLVHLARI